MKVLKKSRQNFFSSQRMKISYLEWENKDAPVILFIHGGRDHSHSWDWMAEEFADDYHLFAIDLRGHGDSDWSNSGEYHFSMYILDIANLVDKIIQKPVIIIAHSMGASIGLLYSCFYPDRVLKYIGIDAPLFHDFLYSVEMKKEEKGMLQSFRDWVDQARIFSSRKTKVYKDVQEAVDRLQKANNSLTSDQVDYLAQYAIRKIDEGYIWKFDNYMRFPLFLGFKKEDIRSLVCQYSNPACLIYGNSSFLTHPTEEEKALFQSLTYHTVNGSHWLHHESLPETVKLIKDFLIDEVS